MPRSPWPRRKRSTKPEDSGAAPATTGSSPSSLERSSKEDPAAAGAAPESQARRASPRKIALDILALREHSVAELRAKLLLRAADREWEPEEIEATLEALVAEGLLSEERFVESFVGSYSRRGRGPVWIRGELERRGISGATIRAAVDSADIDWDAAAEAVRVKRFGATVPADFKERARQARFLQYRGFRIEKVPDT